MRAPSLALLLLFACSSAPTKPANPIPPAPPAPPTPEVTPPPAGPPEPVAAPILKKERLAADTPKTTVAGNTFIAPAGWSIWVQGPATILETPEGDSSLALVDVKAKDADEALDLAWKAYKPDHKWPIEVKLPSPDKDGWTHIMQYGYTVPPNEKRIVGAAVRFANDT